jgi:aldehyde dehydrogenase (NAD+)
MILEVLNKQRLFFESGKTKEVSFRLKYLKALKEEIINSEKDITSALLSDFKKPAFETYITEISVVISEIDLMIKNISSWTKPKKVYPALMNFPSTEYIYNDPYGNCLIIAPWNYPFQLAMAPLIDAIAGGNMVVLKPSELTPNTSNLLKTIISKVFPEDYATVILGDADVVSKLLDLKWDYIFFTGSVKVGKIVAKAAAPNLTPVTLELGGKNPCIVHKSADIKLSAKRIVWGKFLNAGQTCIAPDYILIDQSIKAEFVKALKTEIISAYTENPEQSPDYPRIINEKNLERLLNYLNDETIILGGISNAEDNYLAPTLLDEPKLDSNVMQDEIFGPILPIISYSSETEIKPVISKFEKPLAFYVFAKDQAFSDQIMSNYQFGGGVVNDTIIQFTNHRLPFGGVGESGIGAYHGKDSFYTFTHQKAVVKKATWLDIPFRYAPYGDKIKTIKKVFKWI